MNADIDFLTNECHRLRYEMCVESHEQYRKSLARALERTRLRLAMAQEEQFAKEQGQ